MTTNHDYEWLTATATASGTPLGQWFRVTDEHEGNGYFDEWGDYHPSNGSSVRIVITPYPVQSVTPKGVWLYTGHAANERKWVSAESRKRFAYPTIEEAWQSFRARKAKQARIYMAKFAAAKKAALLAELPLEQAFDGIGLGLDHLCSNHAMARRSRLHDYPTDEKTVFARYGRSSPSTPTHPATP